MSARGAAGAHFATRFDGPVAALAVPGAVGSGDAGALAVVDQVVRGRTVVGRCLAAGALVGVRVAAADRPLQVTVALRWDRGAADWTDPAGRDADLPRLLVVGASGGARRGVLLSRYRRGAAEVRARVRLGVPAGAVPDDGLLVIDFTDGAARLPAALAPAFAAAGPVGVRIDRVDVTPGGPHAADTRAAAARDARDAALADAAADADAGPVDGRSAEWSGLVSSGGLRGEATQRTGAAHSPYLVVNPPPGRPLRCRLRGALLPSRIGGGTAPARVAQAVEGALRRALPAAARPVPAADLVVRAVGLGDGAAVPVELVADGGDLTAVVPATDSGPVLLAAGLRYELPRRTRLVTELVDCGTDGPAA
ncbi:hypothetical protein GCM10010124_23680 [Pilimelia terevasa]|uniref:Uncharacterized protein n=1 Tax=Pilimelia terevasa TaxID=53372 RepID=A0A8J3FKT8_9ACTN|nr:hypothetical protein [Pilimelia terevasa]GGK30174.1 hypothetical protein GCM10010124_23680 [Pilimelia terevasa]